MYTLEIQKINNETNGKNNNINEIEKKPNFTES
jgi:hypothetical protein